MAKLVDNGLELEKTPKLKAAVAALLPHVKTKADSKEEKDHFIPQHIANLLWAVAKLVDNGLELEKTPKLKEAVAALLPHVKTKADSEEEKDHFNTHRKPPTCCGPWRNWWTTGWSWRRHRSSKRPWLRCCPM